MQFHRNFGAINHIGDIGLPRITITPAEETQSDVAIIQSMKRSNVRKRFRSLPDVIAINGRELPARWVA